MKPYRLKHIPTGLYWQPKKHRGSHLSKRGKIYQTKTNILNLGYFSDGRPRQIITVCAHESTLVYKQFKDELNWVRTLGYNEFAADTNWIDWIKEDI